MKLKTFIIYLSISILGVISILLPVFILADLKQYDSPLFPLIRTAIEGISLWSVGFLFLAGFVMRLIFKLSGWKIGLMTMALFPLLAVSEIIVDSSSHNMLPFEIIFYGILTIPAIFGAYSSQGIQVIFLKLKSGSL